MSEFRLVLTAPTDVEAPPVDYLSIFAPSAGTLAAKDHSGTVTIFAGSAAEVNSLNSLTGFLTLAPSGTIAIGSSGSSTINIYAPPSGAAVNSIAASGSPALTSAVVLEQGTNITLTQTGQNISIAATVPASVSSLAASGSAALTGAVLLQQGANVTLTQTGQNISIAAAASGAAVNSIAASGSAALTGAVVLQQGANIALTETGQNISLAVTLTPAFTTVSAGAGTVTIPSYGVPTGGGNAGLYFSANGCAFAYNGTEIASFATSQWRINKALNIAFTSNVSTPGVYFAGENTSGIYRIAANNLGLTISGNKVMDWAASGVSVTGDFEVLGTTGGIGFPNLTSTQRNAFTPPRPGVAIWNTDNGRYEAWNGAAWATFVNVPALLNGENITPNRVTVSDGLLIQTTAAQPSPDVSIRGKMWVIQGGAGVADVLQICIKDASDNYVWKTITLA